VWIGANKTTVTIARKIVARYGEITALKRTKTDSKNKI
jgi:hypothetical protein